MAMQGAEGVFDSKDAADDEGTPVLRADAADDEDLQPEPERQILAAGTVEDAQELAVCPVCGMVLCGHNLPHVPIAEASE